MEIQNPNKLREAISTYGNLRGLIDLTPQKRGQEFNNLIAEMLQSWGIEAKSNIRENGEIDVGFELTGRNYILEAKWESDPVGTGPITKLQKRVRQRLTGTIGIFLSMSGYSEEAVNDLKQGEQFAVLLLEKQHFELMLSGFVPPLEFLPSCIARASQEGDPSPSLFDLFGEINPQEIGVHFASPPEIEDLVKESEEGFKAEVIVSSLPSRQSGVAEIDGDILLATLQEGIFLLNLAKKQICVWFPVQGCARNVVIDSDKSAYIVRKSGVIKLRNGDISVVGGGFVGNVTLIKGDGTVGVFANGRENNVRPTVTILGDELGDEEIFELDYPSSSGTNATFINPDTVLIVGNSGNRLINIKNGEQTQLGNLTNPMGLAQVGQNLFVVSDGVHLFELNIETGDTRKIARPNLQGSVSELISNSSTTGYLYSHYRGAESTKGIIVRWSYE